MAKLTRYSSFEELKSAPLEKPLTPAESAKAHAAFEALLKRLRREFLFQKSLKKQVDTDATIISELDCVYNK